MTTDILPEKCELKPCKWCKGLVAFKAVKGKHLPHNIDGTRHKCTSRLIAQRKRELKQGGSLN